MVRAANTGISAVIDGQGHVLDFLPLGEAGYLDSPLPPPLEPTIYSNLGDLPVLLILLAGFGGAFLLVPTGKPTFRLTRAAPRLNHSQPVTTAS